MTATATAASLTDDGGNDTESTSQLWIERRTEIGRRTAEKLLRERMEEEEVEEEEEGKGNDDYRDHDNTVQDVNGDGPSPLEVVVGTGNASRNAAAASAGDEEPHEEKRREEEEEEDIYARLRDRSRA